MTSGTSSVTSVQIPDGRERLSADLALPGTPRGLVIFAHGSGSGRHSPRNQAVARALQSRGLGTLLADLLTPEEEAIDRISAHLRFDISLLGNRLLKLVDWTRRHPDLGNARIGLFGASTGAAAALIAAAARPNDVAAVVSRGGRPDLAGAVLSQVAAPTLMLVGSRDPEVIELNEWAKRRMRCPVSLEIISGATHLFEEPGTLDQVAARAGDFFVTHLVEAPAGAKWTVDSAQDQPGTHPQRS